MPHHHRGPRLAVTVLLATVLLGSTACSNPFAPPPAAMEQINTEPGSTGGDTADSTPSPSENGATAAGTPSEAGGGSEGSAGAGGENGSEAGAASSEYAQTLKSLGLKPTAPFGTGSLAPNEAGEVMVLLYHVISATSDQWRWTNTPAELRQDLQTLYAKGYRPVSVRALVAGDLDVGRGHTPVAITFDDSTEGQLRFLPAADGSDAPPATLKEAVQRLDPDSALGVLVQFHQKHPDWALRGTFYVNMGNGAFGPDKQSAIKLKLLAALGFEIGNHTLTHADLHKLDSAGITKEVGQNQADLAHVLPDYEMNTLALPFGAYPSDAAAATDGTYGGVHYHNDAMLLVGSNPSPSPFRQTFNPLKIPRIQRVDPAHKLAMTFPYTWLTYFDEHPDKRYVSDGDPGTVTVPASLESSLKGKLDPGQRTLKWAATESEAASE